MRDGVQGTIPFSDAAIYEKKKKAIGKKRGDSYTKKGRDGACKQTEVSAGSNQENRIKNRCLVSSVADPVRQG